MAKRYPEVYVAKKNITWTGTISILVFQAAALAGMVMYFSIAPHLSVILSALVLFFLTGLGLTAGYHRFYTHRAFKLRLGAEVVILFFATLAIEMSALRWAYTHRMHHKYVDQEG